MGRHCELCTLLLSFMFITLGAVGRASETCNDNLPAAKQEAALTLANARMDHFECRNATVGFCAWFQCAYGHPWFEPEASKHFPDIPIVQNTQPSTVNLTGVQDPGVDWFEAHDNVYFVRYRLAKTWLPDSYCSSHGYKYDWWDAVYTERMSYESVGPYYGYDRAMSTVLGRGMVYSLTHSTEISDTTEVSVEVGASVDGFFSVTLGVSYGHTYAVSNGASYQFKAIEKTYGVAIVQPATIEDHYHAWTLYTGHNAEGPCTWTSGVVGEGTQHVCADRPVACKIDGFGADSCNKRSQWIPCGNCRPRCPPYSSPGRRVVYRLTGKRIDGLIEGVYTTCESDGLPIPCCNTRGYTGSGQCVLSYA
jgi:hypothetical protein